MAEIMTYTPDEQAAFDAWVAERPPGVQEMIRRCPPTRLYRNKCGNRVFIESYCENGTVTVVVSGTYNKCAFERRVFGVPVADLVECDLPGPDEPLGATFTDPEEINEFIDTIRPVILANRAAKDDRDQQ